MIPGNPSVLGITDFGPVAGSPVVPPLILPAIVLSSLLLAAFLWLYFRKHKELVTTTNIRSALAGAILVNVVLFIMGVAGIAYWFVPDPRVIATDPAANHRFPTTAKISLHFDRPVDRKSLEKSMEPDTPGKWVFEDPLYATHLYRTLSFYPSFSLKTDSPYTIRLSGIRNFLHVTAPAEYRMSFLTSPSPGIKAIVPSDGALGVDVSSPVTVTLDTPNDHMSEFSFRLDPDVPFTVSTDSANLTFSIRPAFALSPGTHYTIEAERNDLILNLETGDVVARNPGIVLRQSFRTKDTTVPVASVTEQTLTGPQTILPRDGSTDVATDAKISVLFDSGTDRVSAQEHFSIEPALPGAIHWIGDQMIFAPDSALAYGTRYAASVAQGVITSAGASSKSLKSTFVTQAGTVKLAVPAYLQQYTLSCEASSLRMALAYKGVHVSEDDILAKIGVDRTAHVGNTWGNPYEAFVGNVAGTQMADGYGVYWGPIARAARSWRPASEFSGWSITNITNEITKGNPVIIWIYAAGGTRTSWNTPSGQNIYAVRDEHTVVVVGFAGPADNPTSIIVNDPIHGQIYWSRRTFDAKWAIFGNSGVVVK